MPFGEEGSGWEGLTHDYIAFPDSTTKGKKGWGETYGSLGEWEVGGGQWEVREGEGESRRGGGGIPRPAAILWALQAAWNSRNNDFEDLIPQIPTLHIPPIPHS